MNVILIIVYVIFAVSGSTFLKYGGIADVKKWLVPIINMNVSWLTFVGLMFYGFSFICYTILLNKFDLSFIYSLTVSLVYICLMITAFVFFREPVTFQKIIGSILILSGIIIIVLDK